MMCIMTCQMRNVTSLQRKLRINNELSLLYSPRQAVNATLPVNAKQFDSRARVPFGATLSALQLCAISLMRVDRAESESLPVH